MDLSRKTKLTKLRRLADGEGFDTIRNLLAAAMRNSVSPGICTSPDCDYLAKVEPDQDKGWCERCDRKTVASALMIAGLI